MRKHTLLICSLFLVLIAACKEDDSRSCTVCDSDQTEPFEVCRESNGDASVNGEDTGSDYDVYIADLELAGVVCGG